MNGAGLEPWIDDILASVAAKAMEVVIASEGIRLLPPPNYKAQVDGEQTDTAGEDSDHEGMDPHVWLDARNAITMTENIQRALHSDIADRTAGLPHRDFIAFHSAFTYYAEAYGLRQVAIIEESPGRSPSPRYLARLVDLIRDSGVRAVFTEPQFSP